MTTEHPLARSAASSWAGNRDKGGFMPLTTAEIYAKLGVEEGQPLYLLAVVSDEDRSFQGYGTMLCKGEDSGTVAVERCGVLYGFTSIEKAERFAQKTRWGNHDQAYPEVVLDWSDFAGPDICPMDVEPVAADLRELAIAVAFYAHPHYLLIDAGPNGEGRYIPLEDLGWSRELVEVRKAFPVDTHLDRFFGETAEEAEKAFREGRAVENHGMLRLPAHLAEMFFPRPPSMN